MNDNNDDIPRLDRFIGLLCVVGLVVFGVGAGIKPLVELLWAALP